MTTDDAPRTRLIEAAGPIFAEKGYQQATVREICQRAEVNVAAINYYFGDKQRLYIECVKFAHAAASERVPLPEWPAGATPEEKLREFVRVTVLRTLGCKPAAWQVQLMMREVNQPSEAVREILDEYIRPHFALACELFGEVLPPDTPNHVKQKLSFSLVGQCLQYKLAGEMLPMLIGPETVQTEFTTEKLIEHITQVTLASVGLGPPFGDAHPTSRSLASED